MFLLFQFTCENQSVETVRISSIMDFALMCDEQVYSISFSALIGGSGMGLSHLDVELQPGKTVTGFVGLEVSEDWNTAAVRVELNPFGGESAMFLVKNDA